MGWFIFILIIALTIFIIYLVRRHKKQKLIKKNYAKETAIARLNMHNHKFVSQDPFMDGWSLVRLNSNRYAYVNEKGEFLGNLLFDHAETFNNNVAVASVLNKGYCIIKSDGSFLIPPSDAIDRNRHIKFLFDKIYLIEDTITLEDKSKKKKCVLVKANGTFLTKEIFDHFGGFSDGTFKIHRHGLTSEIDSDGNLIFIPYKKRLHLKDDLYKISQEDYKWGVYRKSDNKTIIPFIHRDIMLIPEYNSFIVKSNETETGFKSYIFDEEGNVLFSSTDCDIYFWGNKYYHIHKPGVDEKPLSGIVDKNGKILVQPSFTEIWVKDGHFFVSSRNGRCGKVNELGYSSLEYDKYKLVHTSEWDFPTRYFPDFETKGEPKVLYSCNPSFIIVFKNGKCGVVDLNGDIVIPIEYQDIDIFEGQTNAAQWYLLKQNGKYGVADLSGKITIPILYDKIECKMDMGTEIPPSNSRVLTNHTFRDFEYENFCKRMPRYFILTSGDKQKIVNYNNEPYTPKPTRIDLIRQKYSLQDDNKAEAPNSSPAIEQKINSSASNNLVKKYLLFFDTETTGLPFDYHAPTSATNNWPRLVQLSWLLVDDNLTIVSEKDFIIKPSGFSIPESASELHGITTERALSIGEDLHKVLTLFLNDVAQSKICIGHNIDFDKKVVGCELYRDGTHDILASLPAICTMQSTVNYCCLPGEYGYKYPKLQELYHYLFGLSFVDAHNSLADVKATLQCYKELKSRNKI